MSKHLCIIFVCTANVCRSPMAQQLMQHALAAQGQPLNHIKVLSAAVYGMDNEHASANAIKALEVAGLNIKAHRSRQLTQTMLDEAIAVFCMTQAHKQLIHMHFKRFPKHMYLMREFIPGVVDQDIPDPYGQSLCVYKACRDSMVEAIPSLIQFLKTLDLKI